MKIKMTRGTVVAGEHAAVDDELEVDEGTAKKLEALGKAEIVQEPQPEAKPAKGRGRAGAKKEPEAKPAEGGE